MNWLSILAMLEDLIQIAGPIVSAHTTGQGHKIADTVDSVVTQLKSAVPLPPATGIAAEVESVAGAVAPIAGSLIPTSATKK